MQRTLVLIKPDAVADGVWLDIIKIYEKHELAIGKTAIFAPLPASIVQELYREHEGKSFYDRLVSFMQSGITIALCIVGLNAIALVRAINGATRPHEAKEGTIRHLYGSTGTNQPANAVHGSANPTDAERELKLVFGEK